MILLMLLSIDLIIVAYYLLYILPLFFDNFMCTILHYSHTLQSIAENITAPWLGIELGPPQYKTIALIIEPKSQLSDAIVRD